MSRRHEIIPGVHVNSAVEDEVRTVTVTIRHLGAALVLTQEEAITVANQLRHHGYIDRTHPFSIPLEEPDEALVLQLTESIEPFRGPIPRGQKPVYARELHNLGWSVRNIMRRLRMSGSSLSDALADES